MHLVMANTISPETRREHTDMQEFHLWLSWLELSRFSPFGPSGRKRQTRGASGRRRATGQRDADSGPFGGFLNRDRRARPRGRRANVVGTRFPVAHLGTRQPSESSGTENPNHIIPTVVREGGVVTMADPFKSDSGKRRSALTSAFEELALHTANLNDEDGFSAHVTYDAVGNVRVTENEQTLEPPVGSSLGRPTPLRGRAFNVPDDDDAEARSYGRQHGSSQGLNMLAASARAEEAIPPGGGADSTLVYSTTNEDPATPKVGTPESVAWSAYLARGGGDVSPTRVKEGGFRFSGDGGRPTESALAQSRGATQSTESVKMAYSWNPGTVLGGGGSEKPSVFATSRRVPIADRGESMHGTSGELARALAKVVVVHPPHEEEDECCEMTAGRTQRGSFSSLLLLEAQELFDTMETLGDSPEDEVIESADRVAVAAAN